ncbi:MAG: hypothetical protein AAF416_22550 [Pseudomonadota bacterium]
MTPPPSVLVLAMSICAFGGGLALKQYSVSRDVLWLVAGFCAYGLSNVFLVLVMDQSGIARAMVVASAAQIVLTTIAAILLGERIGVFGFAAAMAACIAVGLTFLDTGRTDIQRLSDRPSQAEQAGDVEKRP